MSQRTSFWPGRGYNKLTGPTIIKSLKNFETISKVNIFFAREIYIFLKRLDIFVIKQN